MEGWIVRSQQKQLKRRCSRHSQPGKVGNLRSKAVEAGQRVLESITHYLEKKLKLRVNREKSGVGRPSKRKFLGYSVYYRKEIAHLKVVT